jgi:MscS family membrane protein
MILKILFISLLTSFSLFGQTQELKSPRQTMHTFLDAMEKVKKGDAAAINQALLTLDLTTIDPALRNLVGKISAERLINTIDRISKIDYSLIPNHETGPKWFFRKQTISQGDKIFEVEIALNKTNDGNWKFSPETILSVENFYSSLSHLKVVDGVDELTSWRSRIKDRMPAWMGHEHFWLKDGQWISLLALFIFSSILMLVMRTFVKFYFSQQARKTTLPFGLLVFSLVWLVGVRFLEFDVEVLAVLIRIAYITTAFSSVWSALHLVDYISYRFEKASSQSKYKFDDVLVPLLKKSAKVLVVSFGALFVAHSMAFDVASILAGLGIGGVAIAFAAKDTIANIFGSVTVIIDRPFYIGDYVSLEKGIEGTVEQVGFRSTRLRTPYNSVVTVPNSVLANMSIDNYGMRNYRRYKTILFFEHSTAPEILEDFCNRLRLHINLNPLILHEQNQIYIHDVSERGLHLLVNVFFLTSSGVVELEERQKFIVVILRLASELNLKVPADFAARSLLVPS